MMPYKRLMIVLILAIGTASACGGKPEPAPQINCVLPPPISAEEMPRLKKWRAGVCADPRQALGCRYLKWAYRAEYVARALAPPEQGGKSE
jgi:hypothetical protein